MNFTYLHLRGAANTWPTLADELRRNTVPSWREAGISVWGCWQGLFGVASNELLVMTVSTGDMDAAAALAPEITVVEQWDLAATVRPTTPEPCTLEGLYVFRRFATDTANIEEVAALSAEAWKTFEGTERYATQPHGLFAPRPADAERCEMLLVTWYDGFESWSTSRAPAPEARQNFQRRRELTHSTVAVATRLIDLEASHG